MQALTVKAGERPGSIDGRHHGSLGLGPCFLETIDKVLRLTPHSEKVCETAGLCMIYSASGTNTSSLLHIYEIGEDEVKLRCFTLTNRPALSFRVYTLSQAAANDASTKYLSLMYPMVMSACVMA